MEELVNKIKAEFEAFTTDADLQTEKGNKDAHYYHRFIVWDQNWNIVSVSDDFKFMTGMVEFSCGLAIQENSALITFGFQDNVPYFLEIPLDYFDELLNIK